MDDVRECITLRALEWSSLPGASAIAQELVYADNDAGGVQHGPVLLV